MIERDQLASYLNDRLDCQRFDDYAPNGLQIEGSPFITRLCTAVSASEDTIEKAIDLKADALLVHHGFFWKGEDPTIKGMKKKRISQLLQSNISLFAYHLPLDCHLEWGNNAQIGKLLSLDKIESHAVKKVSNLLWIGSLDESKTPTELRTHLAHFFKRNPLHVAGSTPTIQRIAWCSGAAQDFIEQAHELKAEAYLSGEISERTYYQAKELGIHYFSCGHHATERYGVQALGAHLALQFDLKHTFIDSDNPI